MSLENPDDRKYAVELIEDIRKKKKAVRGKKNVRVFKVPKINFDATTLYELTDLSLCTTEPPVTSDMNIDELKSILHEPLKLGLPCSTVAVERAVKATTKAAQVSADPLIQDGSTILSNSAVKKNPVQNRDKVSWNII